MNAISHTLRAGLAAIALWTAVATPLLATPAPTPTPVPLAPLMSASFTPSMEDRVRRGEIVVTLINRHPVYHLDVYGAVSGTMEDAWQAITTYDAYNEFLPLVTKSSVRKRVGNTVHQYVLMNPPWPFHEQWMVNIVQEDKRRYNLSWVQGEGNVKMEHGYWQVTPLPDGRAKVQYHLTVDPWMDAMPGWVVEWVTRTVMPDILKGVRKRVAANQRARK